MGPPCEHGGRLKPEQAHTLVQQLQWGRRVNTAEGRHWFRWFFPL